MKYALTQLTERIERHRSQLMGGYREFDLHKLRVAIRQVRSLIALPDAPVARRWKKRWKHLGEATNSTRDLDITLGYLTGRAASGSLATAGDLLTLASASKARANAEALKAVTAPRIDNLLEKWRCSLDTIATSGEDSSQWARWVAFTEQRTQLVLAGLLPSNSDQRDRKSTRLNSSHSSVSRMPSSA